MSELSRMHRHQGRNNKGRKDRESAQSLGRRTSTQPGLTDEEWSRTPTSTPAKEVPRRSRKQAMD